MPPELRIVVVSSCAGSHAVVATDTAIEIDHHGLFAIDESVINQKVHHVLLDLYRCRLLTCANPPVTAQMDRQTGEYVLANKLSRNANNIDITDSAQACSQCYAYFARRDRGNLVQAKDIIHG